MIPDLITADELARIEAKTDSLISTARGTIALDPEDTIIPVFIRTIHMLEELHATHDVTADRLRATGAVAPAAHHVKLANYARQIRAERLLMLEFLL